MLEHLHVKNLALIREAEIDFTEGLNIDGETERENPSSSVPWVWRWAARWLRIWCAGRGLWSGGAGLFRYQ